jgi:protein-tyrosine kinase
MQVGSTINQPANGSQFFELIRTVFQPVDDLGRWLHRVVAFTSVNSGEGVSYIVDAAAKSLAANSSMRVLAANSRSLQSIGLPDRNQIASYCTQTSTDNLLKLDGSNSDNRLRFIDRRAGIRTREWKSDPSFRTECMAALRWNFDFILIDCPSLATSTEATEMTQIVSGYVLVVEAGRTSREEIARGVKSIESAGGKVLGCVLNRRKYPVPSWLFKLI